MQKARSGFAACASDAKIYFCGGNSGGNTQGGTVLNKFEVLDI